jgi:hypothetical protein
MRIAIGILIAGIAASANAGVIFSNLGAGDSFGMTSGWVVGNSTSPVRDEEGRRVVTSRLPVREGTNENP